MHKYSLPSPCTKTVRAKPSAAGRASHACQAQQEGQAWFPRDSAARVLKGRGRLWRLGARLVRTARQSCPACPDTDSVHEGHEGPFFGMHPSVPTVTHIHYPPASLEFEGLAHSAVKSVKSVESVELQASRRSRPAKSKDLQLS